MATITSRDELQSVKDELTSMYPNLLSTDDRPPVDDINAIQPGNYAGVITGCRVYTNYKNEKGTALAVQLTVYYPDNLSPVNGDYGKYEKYYNYSSAFRWNDLVELYQGLALTVIDENGNQVPISTPSHVIDADPSGRKVNVTVMESTSTGKNFIGSIEPWNEAAAAPEFEQPQQAPTRQAEQESPNRYSLGDAPF